MSSIEHQRLMRVERQLERANAAPTFPIYDFLHLPQDAVEGQLAVGIDDSIMWYHNSWGQIAAEPPTATDLPQDPVEGQVVIGNDTNLYWYSNGAWHMATGQLLLAENPPQDVVEGQIAIDDNTNNLCWRVGGDWYFHSTIPFGYLTVDHYHMTMYFDGDLLFDIPRVFFLSQPPFPLSSAFVTAAQGLHPGATPGWRELPATYNIGLLFGGGFVWRYWVKNVKLNGTMINNMQGSSISPFINSAGSWGIASGAPGGGKGAIAGSTSDTMFLPFNGSVQYNGTPGTLYSWEFDFNIAPMQQDNISWLGFGFQHSPNLWVPWHVPPVYPNPIDEYAWSVGFSFSSGSDNNPGETWFIDNIGTGSGSSGPPPASGFVPVGVTAGPAYPILLTRFDTAWHHFQWDVTYTGQAIEAVNPYVEWLPLAEM